MHVNAGQEQSWKMETTIDPRIRKTKQVEKSFLDTKKIPLQKFVLS